MAANPWALGAKIGWEISKATGCKKSNKYGCVTGKGETSNPNANLPNNGGV